VSAGGGGSCGKAAGRGWEWYGGREGRIGHRVSAAPLASPHSFPLLNSDETCSEIRERAGGSCGEQVERVKKETDVGVCVRSQVGVRVPGSRSRRRGRAGDAPG
jgi:hypothetical protein